MAIPTTRTHHNGRIEIDKQSCTVCGLCVSVCKDFSLIKTNGSIEINPKPVFGCIGCGHCMAICPTGAIRVTGRETGPDDLFELPDITQAGNFNELLTLMQRRRSIREFRKEAVPDSMIAKILEAATTAPMGLPPSDVSVLVINGIDKNRAFAHDFCELLRKMKWLVSPLALTIMRPVWGKDITAVFRDFVKPLIRVMTQNDEKKINVLSYDAPLSMYFYASPFSDPADPIIAATYAMLTAESLGLGTCMIGSVHPMIQQGKPARDFRKKWNIRHKSREGLIVLFGYPGVKYHKGIRRTFAAIDYQG